MVSSKMVLLIAFSSCFWNSSIQQILIGHQLGSLLNAVGIMIDRKTGTMPPTTYWGIFNLMPSAEINRINSSLEKYR